MKFRTQVLLGCLGGISAAVFLGNASRANAELAQPIQNIPCAPQVYHALEQWKEVPQHWISVLSDVPATQTVKSPTDKTGTWYFLSVNSELKRAVLSRRTPSTELNTVFTMPACQPTVALKSLEKSQIKTQYGTFSDGDLDKILHESSKKKSAGVIYLWSPHMVLSMKGYNELKDVCAKLGLRFTPVLDPNTTDTDAENALKEHQLTKAGLARVDSVELSEREGLTHFPSIFVYSNGKIVDGVIPGYQTADRYAKIIQERLK